MLFLRVLVLSRFIFFSEFNCQISFLLSPRASCRLCPPNGPYFTPQRSPSGVVFVFSDLVQEAVANALRTLYNASVKRLFCKPFRLRALLWSPRWVVSLILGPTESVVLRDSRREGVICSRSRVGLLSCKQGFEDKAVGRRWKIGG